MTTKTLKEYLGGLSGPAREDFAQRCKTSYGHLRNVAYGKKPAESLCILIELHSGREVLCESLRSDVMWWVVRGSQDSVAGGANV